MATFYYEREQLKSLVLSKMKLDTQYEDVSRQYAVIPFRETATSPFKRVSVLVEVQAKITDSSHLHTTVLGFDPEDSTYFLMCSNAFLEGTMSEQEAIAAADAVAKDSSEASSIKLKYGSLNESKACGFYSNNSDGEQMCKHVRSMFVYINDNFDDVLSKLATTARQSTAISGRTPRQQLEKYAFKKHIMLIGTKGSGKTTLARRYAKEHNVRVIDIAGHDGVEASTLIGHLVPYVEKVKKAGQASLFENTETAVVSMKYLYGGLAEGMALAQAGEKAIVIIDEAYRIPSSQRQVLVSTLAPVDGFYILPTDNLVYDEKLGDYKKEIIKAPVENFWVIGTTNIGAGYDVEAADDALEDRFRQIRMDTEEDELSKILSGYCVNRGFSSLVQENLMSFYNKMMRLREDEKLEKLIVSRHLVEAVMFAVDEGDVKETLRETALAWVSNSYDGSPDKNQMETVYKTIDHCFK